MVWERDSQALVMASGTPEPVHLLLEPALVLTKSVHRPLQVVYVAAEGIDEFLPIRFRLGLLHGES